MKRIVLAYSGLGDDASLVRELARAHDAEVVTLTLDLGQGRDLHAARDRALSEGAVRAHVLDVREHFAEAFVLPSLKSGALRDESFPQADALARSVIAAKLVEVAHMEHAGAVAHGGAKPHRSEGPIDEAIHSLDPALEIVHTRPDCGTKAESRSGTGDMNLWARFKGLNGDRDETRDDYVLTKSLPTCPEEPAFVEVDFESGAPVAINGVRMPFLELLESLTAIAGTHGVGRMQSAHPAVMYEAPAAAVLHAAHRQLQAVHTTAPLDRFSRIVAIQYADLIDQGQWFTPLREALDAFVDRVQHGLTGVVRVRLLKGQCRVIGTAASRDLLEPLPLRSSDIDDHLASGLMFGSGTPAGQSAQSSGTRALVIK